MMKKLSGMMEWVRPAGIVLVYFLAEYCGTDAISKFHILGPIKEDVYKTPRISI